MATKYGKAAQRSVKKTMHKFKTGLGGSGVKKRKIKSRKQAIAIGLSKARKAGAKVPKRTTAKKTKRTTTTRKTTRKTAKKRW